MLESLCSIPSTARERYRWRKRETDEERGREEGKERDRERERDTENLGTLQKKCLQGGKEKMVARQ
jgi:hypothetical protein